MASVALHIDSNFQLKGVAMKHYHHLTQEQRYLISALIKTDMPNYLIAQEVGCTRQTLWREGKRNTGGRGYRPQQAHTFAQDRHHCKIAPVTAFGIAYIRHLITGDSHLSPEQIHGRLQSLGWKQVPSHEWIYQYIYRDKREGGTLHQHLRCQKTYRKRGVAGNDRRGQIPNKVSIHDRPSVIETRSRLGDIEGDTIMGRHHQGAVLTLLERKSLYVWLAPLKRRTAERTAAACIKTLTSFKAHSITFDNGKEFTQHQAIATGTGADIYFADPYHSNQRARNENSNGLIRQYLPKSMRLDAIEPAEIARIQLALNTRPRKTLGWKTPEEVLSSFERVALRV
jgi:transposase, IS30 family